jgi:hypothetical protein
VFVASRQIAPDSIAPAIRALLAPP